MFPKGYPFLAKNLATRFFDQLFYPKAQCSKKGNSNLYIESQKFIYINWVKLHLFIIQATQKSIYLFQPSCLCMFLFVCVTLKHSPCCSSETENVIDKTNFLCLCHIPYASWKGLGSTHGMGHPWIFWLLVTKWVFSNIWIHDF